MLNKKGEKENMNDDFRNLFLSLLEKGISQEQLLNHFSISVYELHQIISSFLKEGLVIQRNCSVDGEIYYQLKSRMKYILPVNYETKQSRVLIISDLHIGHIDSNILFVDRVYDYAKKHGIHIILVTGDYLNGIKRDGEREILDKQIVTIIRDYPFDSSILNYYIGGNHDKTGHYFHLDTNQIISEERPDFINLGYGMGRVKIGDSTIALYHDLSLPQYSFNHKYVKKDVIRFKGHSHQYLVKFNGEGGRPIISVPCLSKVRVGYSKNDSGFLDVTFTLNGQTPATAVIQHINLDGNMILSERCIELHNAVKKKRLTGQN